MSLPSPIVHIALSMSLQPSHLPADDNYVYGALEPVVAVPAVLCRRLLPA